MRKPSPALKNSRSLRILVTAGPTREYLDPVRYISNESSGTMGFALARAAARRGHRVTLVHGPVALRPPTGVRVAKVVTSEQMLRACLRSWTGQDALLMAAAVADYRPVRPARAKLKKSASVRRLELHPTTDILAALARRRRRGQVVVGFALEDRAPRRNAEAKLRRKGLDAIVLNRPAAIGADRSRIEVLVTGRGWLTPPSASKPRHAARLIRLLERLCTERARFAKPMSMS